MVDGEVFNTEETMTTENKIFLRGDAIRTFDEPIEVGDVKDAANARNLKKFTVETLEGRALRSSDFPFDGSVKLVEYNAAKNF